MIFLVVILIFGAGLLTDKPEPKIVSKYQYEYIHNADGTYTEILKVNKERQ